jgi:hypothetical protein
MRMSKITISGALLDAIIVAIFSFVIAQVVAAGFLF